MSLLAVVLAATPYLVKDINLKMAPASSDTGVIATIGSTTYFVANDGIHGRELWKTDGTEAGTVMVKDIEPGGASGVNAYGAVAAGDRLVFTGVNDDLPQIWSSDGTAEGTKRLTDRPGFFATLIGSGGGIVYFNAISTKPYRIELWRTDGTAEGTWMVEDVGPNSPSALGAVGRSMVFYWNTPERAGLFTIDESGRGLRFVVPSPIGDCPFFAISLDDAVLYGARESDNTCAFYRTDGTPEGTRLVHSGFVPRTDGIREPVVRAGNLVFFVATDVNGQRSLWRTDGTGEGTFPVTAHLAKDMSLAAVGSSVFFFADVPGVQLQQQLWKSDGTSAGTGVVDGNGHYPGMYVAAGDWFFFLDWTLDGFDLYRSNSSGTRLVRRLGFDRGSAPLSAGARGNSIIFTGWNAANGWEPWISDGTPAGTGMLKNVREETSRSSSPFGLAERDGTLMFTAFDGDANALWSSDGTAAGTVRVSSNAGVDGAFSTGKLYFFTRPGTGTLLDLWRSDGTAAGTFNLGPVSGSLVPFRDGAVYFGSDGVLWFSDGSPAGTRAVVNLSIREAPLGGGGVSPVVSRGAVYFTARSALWTWDGVGPAPRKVIDLPSILGLADVGGTLFIAASSSSGVVVLYRSDGTSAGTVKIKEETDQYGSSLRMFNVGGKLVLWSPSRLWVSDGTEQGTVLLRTFSLYERCARHDRDFAVAGGVLYWFIADHGESELWRSDGTAEGTFALVHQQLPQYQDAALEPCAAHSIAEANGLIYFTGKDSRYGVEPWVSDGTVSGTHLLFDVNPGISSSNAGGFLRVGRTLYFTAEDGFHGTELWALPLVDGPRRRVTR